MHMSVEPKDSVSSMGPFVGCTQQEQNAAASDNINFVADRCGFKGSSIKKIDGAGGSISYQVRITVSAQENPFQVTDNKGKNAFQAAMSGDPFYLKNVSVELCGNVAVVTIKPEEHQELWVFENQVEALRHNTEAYIVQDVREQSPTSIGYRAPANRH